MGDLSFALFSSIMHLFPLLFGERKNVIHIHFQEVFFISTMLTLLEKKFEIVAE
jgi:hypothetical protein